MKPTTCVWFRKGLRVHDNAALVEAAAGSGSVLPLYVLDPYFARPEFVGAPRYRFLLESLADLDASLRKRGSRLCVVRGETEATLDGLLLPEDAVDLDAGQRVAVAAHQGAQRPLGLATDDAEPRPVPRAKRCVQVREALEEEAVARRADELRPREVRVQHEDGQEPAAALRRLDERRVVVEPQALAEPDRRRLRRHGRGAARDEEQPEDVWAGQRAAVRARERG